MNIPRTSPEALAERSNKLIEHGQFVTLATHGPDGPWASTVNFVPLREPLRLLWYSQIHVQHSRNVAHTPRAAGSIFLTGLPNGVGLDGAQFTGTVRAINDPAEITHLADIFYTRNFPDPDVREQWRRPMAEFHGEGHRRFYELTLTGWWLLDLDHWQATMNEQRVAVDLAALHSEPPH